MTLEHHPSTLLQYFYCWLATNICLLDVVEFRNTQKQKEPFYLLLKRQAYVMRSEISSHVRQYFLNDTYKMGNGEQNIPVSFADFFCVIS